MTYSIRGGLGNQILEFLGCVADAEERGESISMVELNVQPSDRLSLRNDHVSRLLVSNIRVTRVQGTNKFGIWRPSRIRRIFQNRTAVLRRVSLAVEPIHSPRLMHVRLGDRSPVTADRYTALVQPGEAWEVVGDSDDGKRVASAIGGRWVGAGSSMDWRRCLGADVLVGAPSSFTVATMFFNPERTFRMLGRPLWVPDHMVESINEVAPFVRDFQWVHDVQA